MRTVSNWARTETCTPAQLATPRDEAEVAALVRGASASGRHVRVGGALHSWSRVAMTDGLLLSLDSLDAIVAIEGEHVTVQAGIRLHVLVERLAERGLALPITGSILVQSLAGALSTGTHGSSLAHGCLASFVRGVRLVLASGDVLDLGPEDPRLPAAACSLGMLGVIVRVTLAVVPLFRLREVQHVYPFEDAAERFLGVGRAQEYAKFWWLPHTPTASIFHYERTTGAPDVSLLWRRIDDAVVNRYLFAGLLGVGARLPGIIPTVNRLVGAMYLGEKRRTGRYDHVLTTPMPPIHRESEWAIPVERAPEALRWARELLDRDGLRVDFILEARLVKADATWMAPSSGHDVCALGGYAAGGPDCGRYFAAFAGRMRELGGRPHWGKEFAASRDDVTRWYPHAERFRALVKELDPQGTFANDWSRGLF